ncbi:MAG: inositol monophosphatase family protein [Candidatus Nanopelagicales bacterium]
MHELIRLRDLALRIAIEVAPIPASAQPRVPAARTMRTSSKSSDIDLVTELDSATELAILQRIHEERPGDGVLAEEGGVSESSTGYTWVVDPIDGTVNYYFGSPQWCICLGIVDAEGEAVVGVVHAPQLRETYVGVRGHGAFLILNGEWLPLTSTPEVSLDMALLHTGFCYERVRRVDMGRALDSLLPRVRDVRRPGSAALDICAVAAGRAHGYYERDTKPWDSAAASVVAGEAGSIVIRSGDPMGHNLIIVAPPQLAETLRRELAAAGVVD